MSDKENTSAQTATTTPSSPEGGVVHLANLPDGTVPPGFRATRTGKWIPEDMSSGSHSALRMRYFDRVTNQELERAVPDSESSWYEFHQRFRGVKKAIEDATTEGSNQEDDEDDNDDKDDEDGEKRHGERVIVMPDTVSNPRAVQQFLAAINNKKVSRDDKDDDSEDQVVDRAVRPFALRREQQDKLTRIEAAAFEPPDDYCDYDDEPSDTSPDDVDAEYAFERGLGVKRNHADDYGPEDDSEPEEDEVPGTPPPPKRPRIDPNYVPETPSAGSPSTASARSIFVPQSPLSVAGA